MFQVSLKREDFTILGIYNYSVSYYYETICDNDVLPSTSCFGWVNLSLIIVVTGEQWAWFITMCMHVSTSESHTQLLYQPGHR